LSEVTSVGSCERNWLTFDFIHTKKRNRLASATVKNIVKVHCTIAYVSLKKSAALSDACIDWSSDDEED